MADKNTGPDFAAAPSDLWLVPGLKIRRRVPGGPVGGCVVVFTTDRAAREYLNRRGRAGLAPIHLPAAEVETALIKLRQAGEIHLAFDPGQDHTQIASIADTISAL